MHAKGILLSGTFQPTPEAAKLTRAPHANRPSTPVWVRFSDSSGLPAVNDNDPQLASPRGLAIRFHLAEHVHTDIIAHSTDAFPARTAEEFLEFLRSVYASFVPNAPKPSPVEVFLGSHPAALNFVQTPKPFPASFARESHFARTPLRFTNAEGHNQFGRFRIRPTEGDQFLDATEAAAKSGSYLFDEITERIATNPIKLEIFVQIAKEGDVVDDSTAQWPEDREHVHFGTVTLTAIVPNNPAEQRHVIFDPIPRVDGIESAGDPLLDHRADLYLLSGRRRR